MEPSTSRSGTTAATETTLVDYFVVAGYDPDVGLMPEHFGADGKSWSEEERLKPPLQRAYQLCMPRGLRFYTERDVPARPSIHTFANIREDGSRVNGTVITFYEEVQDARLCEAMAELHFAHVRELTARERQTEGRAHVPPGTVSGGTHTLPRGKNRDRQKRVSYYDGGGHNQLFVAKSLCLLTRLPIVVATSAILTALHRSVMPEVQPPPLPLESYIYWLLNELPLPSPGTTLKVTLYETDVVLQRPGARELPFFDYPLRALFDLVDVDKFVRLFTCFLLEHQILLCSNDLSRLMLVGECLCALAFPFRWQLTYVPILPNSQLKFIEAPVPYVMGVCSEEGALPVDLVQNVCLFDVDTARCDFPEDLPTFPGARLLVQDIKKVLSRYDNELETDDIPDIDASPSTTSLKEIPGGRLRPESKRSTNRCAARDDWLNSRMSRSFEDPSYEAMQNGAYSGAGRPQLQPLPLDDVLRNNSAVARVAEIARRAGVVVEMEHIEQELASSDAFAYANSPTCKRYFQEAKLNNAIREVVLARILAMFYSYEHFVVGGHGCADREEWEAARDSLAAFDKAAFLSDQADSHLPFLAAFLETQMFTSFIDAKILAQWEQPGDEYVALFDSRLETMKEKLGRAIVRTPTASEAPLFAATEELINKRADALDYIVPAPHALDGAPTGIRYSGIFPELYAPLLEGRRSPMPSPWKQRHARLRPKNEKVSTPSSHRGSVYGGAPNLGGDAATQIAQQNLRFVEQLLKETKGKTKRMLVDKMGKEAVQLGHAIDAAVGGIEENTLVASFCDLLERIWAHGLQKKHGKSALWTFLLAHQDLEKGVSSGLTQRAMSTSMLTPEAWSPEEEEENRAHAAGPRFIDEKAEESLVGRGIHEIVESIQRELEKGSASDKETPAWGRSILRAANFLVDKIAQASKPEEEEERPKGPLTAALITRTHSQTRFDKPKLEMKKSNSVSDFTAPHWNAHEGGSGSGYGSGTASVESSPRKQRHRTRSPEAVAPGSRVALPPLPTHIAYDLKSVLRMSEIKTDIGYARAFVRLALERKLLHRHLCTLLANSKLLSEMYKPYAFVCSEDEREQFLFHVLSLNAAQFRCFTNTFTKTKMDYQVAIATSSPRAQPAVWLIVEGSLASSPPINLRPNTPFFKFDHKNLGVLSTLRIGQSPASDQPSKWFLDQVIVRNEITGQTYRFPCGRWFGRGVDDGSLERLLVAEAVANTEDSQEETNGSSLGSLAGLGPKGMTDLSTSVSVHASPARARRAHSRSRTPQQRDRSPSVGRNMGEGETRPGKSRLRLLEVEQQLGEAVNALVKYFYAEKQQRAELAQLLCGERGLVVAIEAAFQFGRQESFTTRLFGQIYPWDYVERVAHWFVELSRRGEASAFTREQRELIKYAVNLVGRISQKMGLGKEGRFHVFVLLSIRDHVLPGFLQLMSWTPITAQMYDEPSFLRTPNHLTYLSRLLDSLNEFQFNFEKSLTYGIV